MWRSVRGRNGGYCSYGKSDDSSTGVPTCPFPSRTRQGYRRDGKRLLEGLISKGTGGMPCAGVERRSCGTGHPHPDGHARGRVGHPQCRHGLLPPNARVVLRETDAAPGSGGLGGVGDRRRVPVQVRRTTCGQSVGAMGPSGSARRCTSAMPWDSGECGRRKETEKKQIPGAHKCHARRVRQRVQQQQRRRIQVHGV